MKAIRYHRTGGIEVLQVDEIDKPVPSDDEVLVRIQRMGVNFADTLQRRGMYLMQPTPPVKLGLEAAGVIERVGDRVTGLEPGQRVAVIGNRLYAEYATCKPAMVIPLPDGVDTEAGAAFPVQALTAYHLLYTAHDLKAGQMVLVHSAAGGVGLLAVQMVKMAGATVIGTVSTEGKAMLATQIGADEVINYREQDFAAEVMRITNNRGVDLILDAVGKDTLLKGIDVLAPHGNLVTYGLASGKAGRLDPAALLGASKRVTGFILYTVWSDRNKAQKSIDEVLDWLGTGRLRLTISHRLPLEQAARAHTLIENRKTVGKILLTNPD